MQLNQDRLELVMTELHFLLYLHLLGHHWTYLILVMKTEPLMGEERRLVFDLQDFQGHRLE